MAETVVARCLFLISDVEKGMWFNTAVSTMAAMGILNGYPDGNFYPNA